VIPRLVSFLWYQFNLGTRGLSEGTWRMRIDLGDGAVHTVDFSLRR
jgi:hypothetical protein